MRHYRMHIQAGTVLALLAVVWLAGCPPQAAIQWHRHIGYPDGDDAAYAVARTQDGGYVVAGKAETSAETDNLIYVVKLSAWGLIEWEQSYGDTRNEHALDIQQTPDGGYIVAGQAGSDDDPASDAFMLKLDALGEQQWMRLFDSGGMDWAASVAVTADGGYLLGVGFDMLNVARAVMIKTGADGVEQWRVAGEEYSQIARAMVLADGTCLLAAWRIIPGEAPGAATGEIDLVKASASGQELSRTIFAETQPLALEDIRQTSDGGLVLVGQSDLLFSDSKAFLWKVGANMQISWKQTYGGEGRDEIHAVCPTKDGGFILTGESSPVNNQSNMTLIKTNAVGVAQWTRHFGGADRDVGEDVVQTSDGGYLAAGWSESFEDEFESDNMAVFLVKTDKDGQSQGAETPVATD